MKIRNSFLMLVLLVLIASCREYDITTKINNDGTCERIIRIESDSKIDNLSKLPVYVDGSWTMEKEKSSYDSTKFTLVFSKKFDSIDELNNEISKSSKIKSKVVLEKKFKWFYTYYDYTETYLKSNPFKEINNGKYFTKDELDSLSSGYQSKYLSQKVDMVLSNSILAELIDSVTAVTVKHSMYDEGKIKLLAGKLKSKNGKNLENINSVDGMIKVMENIYGSKSVKEMTNDIDSVYKRIEKKAENFFNTSDISFSTNVILPGIILSTNASAIKSNELSWKPATENYVFTDFIMKAESRSANLWAIILTGIIVLILLIVIFIPTFRRKKTQ